MVDLIRSGNAPGIIRRKGAEGHLPLPPEEQIEILILLSAAREADMCDKALETLQKWDHAEVCRVLASPLTAPDVLSLAAEQVLAGREDFRASLLENPSLPITFRHFLMRKPIPKTDPVPAAAAPIAAPKAEPIPPSLAPPAASDPTAPPEAGPAQQHSEEEMAVEILAKLAAGAKIEEVAGDVANAPPEVTKHDDELTQRERVTLIEKVNRMTVVEKIKAALTGNLETRSLLIRDSNKIISRAVLQSPKISDTEAESYAAAKNVSEEVLRLIATNRKFMKSYVVMRALVNNPRAPIDVTMPLLARVNEKDLKGLSLNRNVPEVIRGMAIKAIKQKEEAAKVKTGKH